MEPLWVDLVAMSMTASIMFGAFGIFLIFPPTKEGKMILNANISERIAGVIMVLSFVISVGFILWNLR